MKDFFKNRIVPLFRIDRTNWWKFFMIWFVFLLIMEVTFFLSTYGLYLGIFEDLFILILLFLISIILAFWLKSFIPILTFVLAFFSFVSFALMQPEDKILNNMRIALTDKSKLPKEGEYIKWGERSSLLSAHTEYFLLRTKETDKQKILTLLYGRGASIPLNPKSEFLNVYRISDDYVIIQYAQF